MIEVTIPLKNTRKTLEAVENMTPVKKILAEATSIETTEKTDDRESEEITRKNTGSNDQIIELDATFELPHVSTFLLNIYKV